jgi:hypothetical protein
MNREAENEMNPIQSMRRLVGSFESTNLVRVTTTAKAPMGRLTKKIHRHPIPLVRAPPSKGPMATAPPITAP